MSGGDAVSAGCESVEAALARLDAQPRVMLRATVEAGRPADGIHRIEVRREHGIERWVLDGRPLRARPAEGRLRDSIRLSPEGECEPAADVSAGTSAVSYDAWAERGSSRIVLRIHGATGLPVDALRDAPELAWGRALSRPTKPPQPVLRPTGARILERIEFEYGPSHRARADTSSAQGPP